MVRVMENGSCFGVRRPKVVVWDTVEQAYLGIDRAHGNQNKTYWCTWGGPNF
jgi:hypothetical protein